MLFHVRNFLLPALAAGLLLSGCGPGAGDIRESRDPLVRRARDQRGAGDLEGAVKAYKAALDRRGDMPQVHFELAAIYHQDRKDYVNAIYHYQRFLELNPSSAKTNLVAMEIRRARMEFAASLPERPSDAVQTIAAMEKEREILKLRIADVQRDHAALKRDAEAKARELELLRGRVLQLGGPRALDAAYATNAAAPVAAVKPAAGPAATNSAPAAAEIYTVKAGDTLARIAREVYRDPAMANVIFEANRRTMKNERDLKVGQKINLPPRRPAPGG